MQCQSCENPSSKLSDDLRQAACWEVEKARLIKEEKDRLKRQEESKKNKEKAKAIGIALGIIIPIIVIGVIVGVVYWKCKDKFKKGGKKETTD